MLHPSLAAAFAVALVLLCDLTPYVATAASVRGYVPLVKLDVYMETLCPASAYFVKEELPKLFLNNVSSIIELSIVPWVRDDILSINACHIRGWGVKSPK